MKTPTLTVAAMKWLGAFALGALAGVSLYLGRPGPRRGRRPRPAPPGRASGPPGGRPPWRSRRRAG